MTLAMFRTLAKVWILLPLLAACNDEGGDFEVERGPSPNPWWVSIRTPVSGASGVRYVSAPGKPAVAMSGSSFVSPTWWAIGGGNSTAGVTVTWLNETNGESGLATTKAIVKSVPLFGSWIDSNTWSATVPVLPGTNRVTVTASDPSGRTGTCTVEFTTAPLGEISAGVGGMRWGAASVSPPVPEDPFNPYAPDSRAQFIVLASELAAGGMTSGSRLEEIHLHCDVNISDALYNFRVRIQGSSDASSVALVSGGWTTVWGPASITPESGSWMIFRFTTGFVWNGADNVLIDLSRDDVGNYSYGGLFIRTGLASRMLAGWSDSGAVWPFDTGLTLSIVDAIPELRFVWTAP